MPVIFQHQGDAPNTQPYSICAQPGQLRARKYIYKLHSCTKTGAFWPVSSFCAPEWCTSGDSRRWAHICAPPILAQPLRPVWNKVRWAHIRAQRRVHSTTARTTTRGHLHNGQNNFRGRVECEWLDVPLNIVSTVCSITLILRSIQLQPLLHAK